ncbi:MAG: threonine/serine dehydratase [Steroidobacteraceae bacterium]
MDSIAAERRIRAYVRETPLRQSRVLSESTRTRVLLKLENLQETGSFKLRGAANKLLLLPKEQAAHGVVAASTGNHALAVATMGRKLRTPVEIFVSETIDPLKRARIESLQARVNTVQGDALCAEVTARRAANDSGRRYVSPYNDADVLAGQGSVAVEMLRQLAEMAAGPLDAVFVAVGGGGLIGGIGTHLKRVSPGTEVVGCWPENSPALYASMQAGAIVDVPEKPTFSTSTAGGVEPGAITLEICRRVVDRSVLVSEDALLDAARRVLREDDELIEGAAGVAVAAFFESADRYAGKTVAIVVCGGNVDPGFEAKLRATEPQAALNP